jgi:hypothetical protein
MINGDESSYQDIAEALAGHPVGNLTRDEDNVTFYWFTNTGDLPPRACTGREQSAFSTSRTSPSRQR